MVKQVTLTFHPKYCSYISRNEEVYLCPNSLWEVFPHTEGENKIRIYVSSKKVKGWTYVVFHPWYVRLLKRNKKYGLSIPTTIYMQQVMGLSFRINYWIRIKVL